MYYDKDQINKSLHQYLSENLDTMKESWKESSKEKNHSMYMPDTTIAEKLEEMKDHFIVELLHVFQDDETSFYNRFQDKIEEVVDESRDIWKPLLLVQEEFTGYREIILDHIEYFIAQYNDSVPIEHVLEWQRKALHAFDYASSAFMQQALLHMDEEIQDKENMILELTAPVILLQPRIGLLPLVGNIDVERGDAIVENTLKQCALKQMDRLYIDLSGVLHINSLVAEKIMQLISALQLLGINTTLSGMRPHMAQQAVQLGISFKHVQVVSDLPQALRINQVPVQ